MVNNKIPYESESQLCLDKLLTIFQSKPEAYIYYGILTHEDTPIGLDLILQSYKTLFDYELKGKQNKLRLPLEKKATIGNPETVDEYTDEFKKLVKTVAVASGAMRRIRKEYFASKDYHLTPKIKKRSYPTKGIPIYTAIEELMKDLNVSWNNLKDKKIYDFHKDNDKLNFCKPVSIEILEGYIFHEYNHDGAFQRHLAGSPNLFRDAKSMCLIYEVLQLNKLKDPKTRRVDFTETSRYCSQLENAFRFETITPELIDTILGINKPAELIDARNLSKSEIDIYCGRMQKTTQR